MACRGFLECILKLLNFLLTVSGLSIVGYGIYLFVEWKKSTSGDQPFPPDPLSPLTSNSEILALGRPMLLIVSISESIADYLPKAWYVLYLSLSLAVFKPKILWVTFLNMIVFQ